MTDDRQTKAAKIRALPLNQIVEHLGNYVDQTGFEFGADYDSIVFDDGSELTAQSIFERWAEITPDDNDGAITDPVAAVIHGAVMGGELWQAAPKAFVTFSDGGYVVHIDDGDPHANDWSLCEPITDTEASHLVGDDIDRDDSPRVPLLDFESLGDIQSAWPVEPGSVRQMLADRGNSK